MTCEEHCSSAAWARRSPRCSARSARCRLERVGVADVFGTSGEPAELMEHFGLTADDIAAAARELLG